MREMTELELPTGQWIDAWRTLPRVRLIPVSEISVPYAQMHVLRAQVAVYERRGNVAAGATFETAREELPNGRTRKVYVAHVQWLRAPMSVRTKVLAWSASGVSVLAGLGTLIYLSRWVIAAAALTVVGAGLVALALRASSGGGGSCSGVHVKH